MCNTLLIWLRPGTALRPVACMLVPLLTLMLDACVYLPNTGPSRGDIADQSEARHGLRFGLVQIDAATLGAIAPATETAGFVSRFGDSPATEPVLGIGDSVAVTIFEAGSEALFANAQGGSASRAVALPEQAIALDGSISVPFAGRVIAAGLSTADLQTQIERKLKGRAAQPQVLVSSSRGASGTVTILGEVGSGARIGLTARGERVLDALTVSGGLRGNIYDTSIELERHGMAQRLPLARLLADDRENIRLMADDRLLVLHQPRTFTVFGATGHSAQVDFGAERVSLNEAVARAGGLDDSRADPRGVFLFRYETAETARRLGIEPVATADGTPVVYQLNLMQASSYFVSQRFAVQDRDVLYVAGARANELQKFLTLLGLVTQPVLSGVVLDNSVK